MKAPILCRDLVFAMGICLLNGQAFAKPWWSSPALKYAENTGVAYSAADPHYMNKDESDQYLYLGGGSGGGTAFLYSIPALIAGTSSNDVAPIASLLCPNTTVWGSWKGGAISDDLKIAITGNGDQGRSVRTTFPLTAPWTTNVTVFCSTNNPSSSAMDGCDFSHDSTKLFSSVYNSTGPNTNLITWSVSYTNGQGIGLTLLNVFTTSVIRIRNVSDYYIGGKDLVYYGEGHDEVGIVPRKVYVYDAVLGTETELLSLNRTSEAGVVQADLSIMNVKVGGVGLDQMHLYVQCNDGAIFIYELNSDGKSVGSLVKSFGKAEVKAILGVDNPRIRSIEFTNDEKYLFVAHKPVSAAAGNMLLQVVWTVPAYDVWRQAKFGSNAGNELIAGGGADPDGDGIANALEYAMGLEPMVSDVANGPMGSITDTGRLAISFRMDKAALSEGVLYTCEACTNLIAQDWTTLGVSERLPRSDSNAWWQVMFENDVPVANAPQRFMRLKVTLP